MSYSRTLSDKYSRKANDILFELNSLLKLDITISKQYMGFWGLGFRV